MSAGRERVGSIDGVRGVAVIVMIVVHVLAFYADYGTQVDSASFVIMDIGKLTAVFILCMGVSSGFSRRRAPRDLARRGIQLLAYGYGLDVLKFIVPMLVFRNLPANLVTDFGWKVGAEQTFWNFLLLGDILHLVGLSLLLVAGLRAVGARPVHLFALAAVIAGVAPLVWGVRGGGPVVSYAADLLFSEGYTVFFPVFPWAAYVLVGFALGDLLHARATAPAAAFARWARIGVALMAVGIALGLAYPPAWKGLDFYRTGPAGVVAVVGFSLVSFQLAEWLWPLAPRVLQAVWTYCSRRVTRLYVISWVAICWLMGWVGFMTQGDPRVLTGLIALVFAITLAADAALDWISARAGRARRAAPPAPGSPATPANLAG
ncbi:MAG TPA: heparan-alpha-glucosaminide N-acetyltransferase domain-containing protein [Kofleriaceae bacterium]|jgi:uncharacterized membrane protein|nr:heparan-alpha-glucosaminide N-acetyltransferase domain-containing protein [Kofleriaceae bacterium]